MLFFQPRCRRRCGVRIRNTGRCRMRSTPSSTKPAVLTAAVRARWQDLSERDRADVPCLAKPRDHDVVEDRTQGAPRSAVRRPGICAHLETLRRNSPGSASRTSIHRAAYACGRRQRAHQHSGQLRQLRRCCRKPMPPSRGSCDLRGNSTASFRANTASASPSSNSCSPTRLAPFAEYKRKVDPEGRFNKANSCPGRDLSQRLYPELQSARRRKPDSRTVGDRRDLRLRSRTACAAANASRSARRMCRAPTCSIARATRSSPHRC